MAGIKRHFLGWDETPLVSACAWLTDGTPVDHELDLSSLTIITPGARVGRQLLGMLVDRADALKVPLSPPKFSTPGEIPDIVFGPSGVPAGPVQRRLAWSRALSETGQQELEALIPHRPDASDQRSLHALASMLEAAHQHLIGEGLRFSDVPQAAAGLLSDTESARWRAAAIVQSRYAELLRQIGLIDTGLAHLDAMNDPDREVLAGRIVLVGVQELSAAQRCALGKVSATAETLIFAPASAADTFDEFGGVRADAWAERSVSVPDTSILFAAGPDDQARRAMEAIASLGGGEGGGGFAPHQISIAAPDATIIPRLERAAERYAGISARPAAGTSIARTGVFQLLRAIEAFLDGETFESLAALLRHPDMERYLLHTVGVGPLETWLKQADDYAGAHIPGPGLDAPFLTVDKEDWTTLGHVRNSVRRLLAPLRERSPSPGTLAEVMSRIYSGRRVGREDPEARAEIRASGCIRDAIAQVASLPQEWLSDSGLALVRLIVDAVSGESIPHDGGETSFELLGWLELPMDPAPVAVITGVNEGFLPETFGSDALLPDTLRERLGIPSARRRLARDAYLLSLVIHSRRAMLITGRHSADGDPLLPSRLLFASDPDSIVRRVQRFADPEKDAVRVIAPRARLVPGNRSDFIVRPHGRVPDTINSMRVTAFRTFLQSPYLFYLEHAFGLAEHEDSAPEIDPMAFGILIHEVVEAFGRGDLKDSSNERAIRDRLQDHLDGLAVARFGTNPAAAVSVQLAIAGARLSEFASWQVGRREEGWHIDAIEWRPASRAAPLPKLTPEFLLRGKIDRIDKHDDGSIAIIDYKTGEVPESPAQTHGRRKAWKDLQLPLYRHLAAERKLPEDPSKLTLAYVTIPGKPEECARQADWDARDLADADAKAIEVATRVRNRDWFDLGPDPPDEGTFAALCGTAFLGAFGSDQADSDGGGE